MESMLESFATDLSEGGEATLRSVVDGSTIKAFMAGGKKFKIERGIHGGTNEVLHLASTQEEVMSRLRQLPGLSSYVHVS